MPGLREFQLGFTAAVLRRQDFAATGLEFSPQDARLARRLSVYRVNARENFTAALAAAYPVLQLELGDERFRGLAWSYQSGHPSTSGNLFEISRQLPGFLAHALQDHRDEYLRDLAQLEWAVQEAMVAADTALRFDPGALATVPASEYGSLRFRLHPSVRLLQVGYPVFGLWQAFHAADPAHRQPSGARQAAAESILVRRAGNGIELHRLDPVEYHCLHRLLSGATLGDLAETALADANAPDLGALLVRWAACDVITQAIAGRGKPP